MKNTPENSGIDHARRYWGGDDVLVTYQELAFLLRDHAQRYLDLEREVLEIRSDMSNDRRADEIRHEIHQRKLNAIFQASNENFANPGPRANTRPFHAALKELKQLEVEIYDHIMYACDTRNPADLEVALDTIRYGQSKAEQTLEELPSQAGRKLSMRRGTLFGVLLGIAAGFVLVFIPGAIARNSEIASLIAFFLFIGPPIAGGFLGRSMAKKRSVKL